MIVAINSNPTFKLERAANGGWIVQEYPNEIGNWPKLAGAFSDLPSMIEALPGIIEPGSDVMAEPIITAPGGPFTLNDI